jgi:hypothetical protein
MWKMKSAVAFVGLMVLIMAPARANAWNGTGHMTVSKLAWDRLDATQRDAIWEVLKAHPHVKEFFRERPVPADVAEREWFFLLASTWPDWLRGYANSKRPEDQAIGKYHQGPRHYINLPLILPADAALFKDRKLDPPAENIVTALVDYLGQLKDPELSAGDRAVALCWLLHLVGDIHQPLHCVAFFSKEYPDGDLGGNLRWVKGVDGPIRLHAYWDDLLGRGTKYKDIKGYAEILSRADYEREKFADLLKKVDFMDWAREGADLAWKYTYLTGDLPGLKIPSGKETEEMRQKAPELPKGYGVASEQLARQQIALAGHRLGDQLDAAFPRKKAQPE